MTYDPGCILQVSPHEMLGGAERVARDLHVQLRADGYGSWMAVGFKQSDDPNVIPLPHAESRSLWSKRWWQAHDRLQDLPMAEPAKKAGAWAIRRIAEPLTAPAIALGLEDYNFPGTRKLLSLTPARPSIVHCHNLHSSYFDLSQLPAISEQVPTILTLHDMWLATGHCGFSMGCERYTSGCGHCPDLSIPPAILRDSTAMNWARKRSILKQSRVYVVTPCQWLMDIVTRTFPRTSIAGSKVIPYGIDTSIFRPGDKREARAALGLPQDALVIVTAAKDIESNVFKDYTTLMGTAVTLAEQPWDRPLFLLGLGGDAATRQMGCLTFQMVPFLRDKAEVVRYYQAADIYLHPAREETFPNVVLEALACGTPVVATRAGGIPEQLRSLAWCASPRATTSYGPEAATGVIVPAQDPRALAQAARWILCDDELRHRLADNAGHDSCTRYDLARQASEYVDFYQEVQEEFAMRRVMDEAPPVTIGPADARRRVQAART